MDESFVIIRTVYSVVYHVFLACCYVLKKVCTMQYPALLRSLLLFPLMESSNVCMVIIVFCLFTSKPSPNVRGEKRSTGYYPES